MLSEQCALMRFCTGPRGGLEETHQLSLGSLGQDPLRSPCGRKSKGLPWWSSG